LERQAQGIELPGHIVFDIILRDGSEHIHHRGFRASGPVHTPQSLDHSLPSHEITDHVVRIQIRPDFTG
jgi:hypothetical protein